MTDASAGSYAFGQFDEKQKELERLKRQAGAARQLERHILTRSGLASGMDVLDLACGPGVVSCELARIAAPGMVTGIDLNPELLEQAEMLAAEEKVENLSFREGNVYDLDSPDNSYDFVYARFLFQHLEHKTKALDEIKRVLKPGGILTIADVDDGLLTLYPEPEQFQSFIDRAARNQASYGGDRFIGRKLGALMTDAGYEQVEVNVDTVTSAQLGMKGFLDITTGYKLGQLQEEDKEIGSMERENIYQLLDHPNAWGFTSVFVAVGKKT